MTLALFNLVTASLFVSCEGNVLSPWGGGPEFFHEVKGGGTKIFRRRQRGGGPEKIGDRPSQTDGPPLLVKNDSSLNMGSISLWSDLIIMIIEDSVGFFFEIHVQMYTVPADVVCTFTYHRPRY